MIVGFHPPRQPFYYPSSSHILAAKNNPPNPYPSIRQPQFKIPSNRTWIALMKCETDSHYSGTAVCYFRRPPSRDTPARSPMAQMTFTRQLNLTSSPEKFYLQCNCNSLCCCYLENSKDIPVNDRLIYNNKYAILYIM